MYPRVAIASLATALTLTTLARRAEAKCSSGECGSNSPIMAALAFHESSVKGAPNQEGIALVGLVKWWVPLDVVVVGDRLFATSPIDGSVVLSGDALRGAQFHMVHGSGVDPADHYWIHIDDVYPAIAHWVDPTGPQIETYALSWTNPALGLGGSLCSLPPPASTADPEPILHPTGTVLFTGDRYDAKSNTVTDVDVLETQHWFNWACAGGVLFKLHLTRHTSASTDALHVTTQDQRQAMLKMFVSDVCGDGQRFTYQGTPLRWDNLAGWGSVQWTEFATEAWWGPDGAVCLDVHRRGDEFVDAIAASCTLPSCADYDAKFAAGRPVDAYVVSRVPDEPVFE